MANVKIPATGTGDATPTVATDTVAGIEFQKVKLVDGTAGQTTLIPLPTSLGQGTMAQSARVVLPSDQSTLAVALDGTDVYINGANAAGSFNLSLPAVSGKTNYVTGFEITGTGATAASVVHADLSGIYVNPMYYHIAIPTLASNGAVFIDVQFTRPIPATGTNVAIVLAIPSFGAGNALQAACLHGFYK